ncbi:MAG: ABC transporter substrate-binding protein [Desulfamplus sp.]|nr:ABC transporter substrate-binding protein [Desulfamplus sp.]
MPKLIFKIFFIIIFILFILPLVISTDNLFSQNSEDIHIAVISPISGPNSSNGKSVIQGIRLYFDALNQAGGINGKRIVLDMYDDEDDAAKAEEQALKIVTDNKALAIIGHESSSCSINGGRVYKQNQIPAISPTSTDVMVTKDNEWYFRTTFHNDFQGRFLANYISKVFQKNIISIIHEDLDYGANLAAIFQKTYQDMGGNVKHIWRYEVKDKNLDLRLKQIVDELQSNADNAGLIFLALHPPEGFKLIKLIRDSGIKNPVLFAAGIDSPEFLKQFDKFPKEKNNPGYYTNGMYAASGIIFDTADENVQAFIESYHLKYGEEANRRAAFSYDAAKVIHKAIINAGIKGKQNTLKEDRKKIRDYLASLNNPFDAVEGVTGFTYFNETGDPSKPISMGIFKNQQLISAPVQIQDIQYINEIPDFDRALKEERVLIMDNKYMYKTNVVYTGIKINKLTEIDVKSLTFMSDFYIWFRYYGDIQPQKIEFLNAVEPLDLGLPVDKKITDQITYQLYHVKGRFRMDAFKDRRIFGEHVLGIGFRHIDMPRCNLIYVTDLLGMGSTESLEEKIRKSQALNPEYGWTVSRVAFYQGISKKESLGNPEHLNNQSGIVDYSRFNIGIRIEKVEFKIRRNIPLMVAKCLAVISVFVLLSTLLIGVKRDSFLKSKSILLTQAISLFLFLLSVEMVLLQWLIENNEAYDPQLTIQIFDILWWVSLGFFLNMAFERFIWIPIEKRANRSIPNLVRRCVSLIVWMLVFSGIIAFVFDQKITSLLATSGMIAMIIGLAIQINISNIFSGIAINIERPFRIGDWIKLNDKFEGKVVDITWRTTRIHTPANNILSVPNSMASEAVIQNFDYPDDSYSIIIKIHVDPEHNPEHVEKILLNAMLSDEEVKNAVVRFDFGEWSNEYLAIFKVKNYGKMRLYRHKVAKRIYHALNEAQIVNTNMSHNVNKIYSMDKIENLKELAGEENIIEATH